MKKKVAIIVTCWLYENKPYLDACIDSILNLDYPQELLDVIIVGRKSYQPSYFGAQTVVKDSDDFGNSEGMNFGASFADKDTDFFLFLNDDTILTKDSVTNLVRAAQDAEIILGPISPCDTGLHHVLFFGFHDENEKLVNFTGKNQTRIEQNYVEPMMNAKSVYPNGLILVPHLFFYAVLIPKKVWDKVGKFAEEFKTGPDDIDYSYRAKKLGIPLAVCLDSLIWHFSGITSERTLTPQMREENAKKWKEKWGFDQGTGV